MVGGRYNGLEKEVVGGRCGGWQNAYMTRLAECIHDRRKRSRPRSQEQKGFEVSREGVKCKGRSGMGE